MLSDFKHISGDLRVQIVQSYSSSFMDHSYGTYSISVLTDYVYRGDNQLVKL